MNQEKFSFLGMELNQGKKIIGELKFGTGWQESTGRPLEDGEEQYFHSTYAYNISPEQLAQLENDETIILDRRLFVDTQPAIGYGDIPNPERRPYKDNPDELILIRIITKDKEPFEKIRKEGMDLGDIGKRHFTGGPENRFDPYYLGYNLLLKKIGFERLQNYNFPHKVITFEVAGRIPIEAKK